MPITFAPTRRVLLAAALGLSLAGVACRSGGAAHPGAAREGVLLRALERSETLRTVHADAATHRLKIELAEVVPGPGGAPTLRRESLDYGPAYWYPASTVKSCAVVAALLELDDLARATGRPIDRTTPLGFHPLFEGEVFEDHDPSHLQGGTVTVEHLARKILLVSDNPGFNRLYDLCGQDGLNARMHALGLGGIKLRHRLSVLRTSDENRRAPRITLVPRDGGAPVELPERTSTVDLGAFEGDGTLVGLAHLSEGVRFDAPMDFARKNEARLRDLLDLQVLTLRPDIDLGDGRRGAETLPLSASDREFIAAVMRQRPRDSADPVYDPADYSDEYSKFLAPGIWRALGTEHVDVLDKIGRAYGFSTTNSYVVDRRTGRAFFLAATLYTNPNGVLNDNVYDYALADRFFAELGEALVRELGF